MTLDTGRRIDVIARTAHDIRAEADYRLLASLSIGTVPDSLGWHLVERRLGVYDWSSALPLVRAAAQAGIKIVWICAASVCRATSTPGHPPCLNASPRSRARQP